MLARQPAFTCDVSKRNTINTNFPSVRKRKAVYMPRLTCPLAFKDINCRSQKRRGSLKRTSTYTYTEGRVCVCVCILLVFVGIFGGLCVWNLLQLTSPVGENRQSDSETIHFTVIVTHTHAHTLLLTQARCLLAQWWRWRVVPLILQSKPFCTGWKVTGNRRKEKTNDFLPQLENKAGSPAIPKKQRAR